MTKGKINVWDGKTKREIKKLQARCLEMPCKANGSKRAVKCKDCPLKSDSVELFGINILTI